MTTDLDEFRLLDLNKNRALAEKGKRDDRILAFRTTGSYWGREPTVVLSFNPRTARKQRYAFERRMLTLKKDLYLMPAKMRDNRPQW